MNNIVPLLSTIIVVIVWCNTSWHRWKEVKKLPFNACTLWSNLLVAAFMRRIYSMFHIFAVTSGVSLVTSKSAVVILKMKLDKSKHLIEVTSLTSLKSIKTIPW
ncbi:hypothetical protein TRVL_09067 [Trypanosoma vivax]|nr:hypothetical protein TRVL_09067 [Trypanosoma vivax]